MAVFERACIVLLECFDVAETDGPVVGDLLEELHSGKSRLWLLREMLVAISGTVAREIASNKLLSLRAAVTGLLVAVPLNALLRKAPYAIGGIGNVHFFALTCLTFAIAGAAIGCKFPRRPVAMATAFTFYALFAKASLIVMNLQQFRSPSDPLRLSVAAAAVILPPVCALAGALLLRCTAGNTSAITGETQ